MTYYDIFQKAYKDLEQELKGQETEMGMTSDLAYKLAHAFMEAKDDSWILPDLHEATEQEAATVEILVRVVLLAWEYGKNVGKTRENHGTKTQGTCDRMLA